MAPRANIYWAPIKSWIRIIIQQEISVLRWENRFREAKWIDQDYPDSKAVGGPSLESRGQALCGPPCLERAPSPCQVYASIRLWSNSELFHKFVWIFITHIIQKTLLCHLADKFLISLYGSLEEQNGLLLADHFYVAYQTNIVDSLTCIYFRTKIAQC